MVLLSELSTGIKVVRDLPKVGIGVCVCMYMCVCVCACACVLIVTDTHGPAVCVIHWY